MSLRVTFWHSDKPRERILADAWANGIAAAGDDRITLRALEPTIPADIAGADVAVMVGVKSRELYRAHWEAGVHVVMIDKGYTRHAAEGPVKLWEYWRVSVDAHHPTRRLTNMGEMPSSRWDELKLVINPWRKTGDHIVLAGSSAKYHEFYKLRDPTRWARNVIAELRELTKREIVYRPKPSWSEAVPIEGSTFSMQRKPIEEELWNCHALITHGSNACFESILLGVPCIVLGDAVAKPISSTWLGDIETPRLATYAERHRWFNNLAFFQWTMPEIAAGAAWRFLRPQIYGY